MRRLSLAAILFVITAMPASAIPLSTGLSALSRTVGHCGDSCVVSSSGGGRIMDFEDAADAIRATRKRLVIDGYCASACMTMADRARPRTCITSRAVFAYHKTNRNRPIPLRADLRRWIFKQGGFPEFTGRPGVMPNHVARRFWPMCRSTDSA